ncbi:MAG: type II secretion system major pseudopilin GspG [Planctomycetota bacterium]
MPCDRELCIRVNGRSPKNARGAFSLIEIMVVLVIIGLLTGLIGVNVRSNLIRARITTTQAEISTLQSGLEDFNTVYGRYPTNQEGLEVLLNPTEKLPEPILTGDLLDAWDRPYLYNQPGSRSAYEIISLGADGQIGGEGRDADISSNDANAVSP